MHFSLNVGQFVFIRNDFKVLQFFFCDFSEEIFCCPVLEAMSASAEKQGGMEHVPAWDGQAKGWRRYVKEVQWYMLGTKPSLRPYLASRLITKLSGPARLLAMTWQLQEFNGPDGVRVLLSKLSKSPLVRKSLPNAASTMAQYFSFKRYRGEAIANFLIREALHYEEFR